MLDASLFGVAKDQYNDIHVERMTVRSPLIATAVIRDRCLCFPQPFITHWLLLTSQEYNVREYDRPARYFRFHDKRGCHPWPLEQH